MDDKQKSLVELAAEYQALRERIMRDAKKVETKWEQNKKYFDLVNQLYKR